MNKGQITQEIYTKLSKIKYNLQIAADERKSLNELTELFNPAVIGELHKSASLKPVLAEIRLLIQQIK